MVLHVHKESSVRKALHQNLRRKPCAEVIAVQQGSQTTSRATRKQGLEGDGSLQPGRVEFIKDED